MQSQMTCDGNEWSRSSGAPRLDTARRSTRRSTRSGGADAAGGPAAAIAAASAARGAKAAAYGAGKLMLCLAAAVMAILGSCVPALASGTSTGEGPGTIYVVVTIPGGPGCPVAYCSTGAPPGGQGSSGPAQWDCTWSADPSGGAPPAGEVQGAWYFQVCYSTQYWIGGAGAGTWEVIWVEYPPGTASHPSAGTLAQEAESEVSLPQPVVQTNPNEVGGVPGTIVNVLTWLWVDPSMWHAYSATASSGGLSATVVADPISVMWSTGDGDGLTCDGPGVVFNQLLPWAWQSTYCGHIYTITSAGQPSSGGGPNGAGFLLSAKVLWSVSWSASDGQTGSLPEMVTASSTRLRVEQIQSVNNDL